jgi:hypothetical protein
MKILFFVDNEYPGFRGSELEKEIVSCGVKYLVTGRGVDLVLILVEDERQESCVLKKLYIADIPYVFAMEGAPRVLRYVKTRVGNVLAEVKFS